MPRVRVPVFGTVGKAVNIQTDATYGAQLGVDFFDEQGNVIGLKEISDLVIKEIGGTGDVNEVIFEEQIVDGSILARVASDETITGAWDFNAKVDILGGNAICWYDTTNTDAMEAKVSSAGGAGTAWDYVIFGNTTTANTSGEVFDTTSPSYEAAVTNFNVAQSELTTGQSYLYIVQALISAYSSFTDDICRLVFDGNELATQTIEQSVSASSSSTYGAPFFDVGVVTANGGADFRLEMQVQSAGSPNWMCASGGLLINTSHLPNLQSTAWTQTATGDLYTNSASWQNTSAALTLAAGDYLIMCTGDFDYVNGSAQFALGITDGTSTYQIASGLIESSADYHHLGGSFILKGYAGGTVTVRVIGSGTTVYTDVEKIKLYAVPLSDFSAGVYSAQSTGTFFNTAQTTIEDALTVTAADIEAGSHWVMLTGGISETNGTQLTNTSGAYYDADGGGDTAVDTNFVFRRPRKNTGGAQLTDSGVALTWPAGPVTFTEGQSVVFKNRSRHDSAAYLTVGLVQPFVLAMNLQEPASQNTMIIGNALLPMDVNASNIDLNASVDISGALIAESTAEVTGAATFSSTVDITGNSTVGGTLGVTGVADFDARVDANADLYVYDELRVYDSLGTDYMSASHNGTTFAYSYVGTTNVTHDGASVHIYNDTLRMGQGNQFQLVDAISSSQINLENNLIALNISMTGGIDGVYIQDGMGLRIYDSTNTDYLDMRFLATNQFEISAGTAIDWLAFDMDNMSAGFAVMDAGNFRFYVDKANSVVWVRDGWSLRISDSTNSDYHEFLHDGTNAIWQFANTTSARVLINTLTNESFAFLDGSAAKVQIVGSTFDRLWVRDGWGLRVSDALDTDWFEIVESGSRADLTTNINNIAITPGGNGTLFRGGKWVRIQDSTNVDYIQLSHDGVDADLFFSGTSFAEFSGVSLGYRFDEDIYVTAGISCNSAVTDNNGLAGQIAFMDVASGIGRFGSYNWDTAAWQPAMFAAAAIEINSQGGASDIRFQFSGTDQVTLGTSNLDVLNGLDFRVRDGGIIYAYESTDVDYARLYHNGTTGKLDFSDQGQILVGDTAKLGVNSTSDLYFQQQWFVLEQAAADSDFAGYGQFWVVNNTPNRPRFTDDAGNDFWMCVSSGNTGGTGSAGAGNQYVEIEINGNVYKVLHDGTV